jgi:hypothetical protein
MNMPHKTVSDQSADLDEIIEVFSAAAIKCVDIFFARPCSVLEPWHLTNDIDCGTDRIVTIGYANQAYQAITAIGINREDCFRLFGKSIHDDEFLDIFGELANNYCAVLMDSDDFTKRFGVLHQSVPVLYSKGMPFLPFISGVRGRVGIGNGAVINAGFSVKRREIVK